MCFAADRNRYLGLAQGLLTRACIVVGIQAAVSVAEAALTITASEIGGNVVFSGAGSIDITGLTYNSDHTLSSIMSPEDGFVAFAAATTSVYISPSLGVVAFGPGVTAASDSVLGNEFIIYSDASSGLIGVPVGYSSGDPLSFSATFNGSTMASLGMTPGTYQWTLPSDTVTLNVGAAVVPEPTTYIAMAGFAGLGVFVWRRRRAKAKAAN